MAELKDSGNRRDFGTGAVRDAADGKGRCDLLPLTVVGNLWRDDVLYWIDNYIRYGNIIDIQTAIKYFVFRHKEWKDNLQTAILEVSKQYEDGCRKYGDRNWEKGIPLHCYIDSGVRHYLKYLRGDNDEPHDRAFVWNMLGAIWTQQNKPELIDLPFAEDLKPCINQTDNIEELSEGHGREDAIPISDIVNMNCKHEMRSYDMFCPICGKTREELEMRSYDSILERK
ncbi:MAG: hypothetical protein GX660_25685 [Clostridiaceae bacterium]|nr:hypothetical protein [Clostridiaceae bacterium]